MSGMVLYKNIFDFREKPREDIFDFREKPRENIFGFREKLYKNIFGFRDYFRPYRIPMPEIIQGAAAYPGIKSSFFSRFPM